MVISGQSDPKKRKNTFERKIVLSDIKLVPFDRSRHGLPEGYFIYPNMSRFR